MSERPGVPRRAAAPRKRGGWFALPDRRWGLMKWALVVAMAVYALLVVRSHSARDVDFALLREKMAAAPGLEALHVLDANALQERLGTAPDGLEGFWMAGSDEIMNVSELLVTKGPQSALEALRDGAEGRLQRQKDVFASYGTDQMALLEGAALYLRGDYLFYGVGDSLRDWEDAFLSAIR